MKHGNYCRPPKQSQREEALLESAQRQAGEFWRLRDFGSFDPLVAALRGSMDAASAREMGLHLFTSKWKADGGVVDA